MLKNLKLYLDMYDIEPQDAFLSAGEILEKNSKKELLSYCSKGYVLHFFHKLLNNEIKVDDFLKV
ncbi:MAG: hypothetical protein ACOZBL_00075 [Patescibacteria group bacterium]